MLSRPVAAPSPCHGQYRCPGDRMGAVMPASAWAQNGAGPKPMAPMPAHAVQPFDMADVTLADSPFLHAQKMTEAYLMRLQPDRLLANFRKNAGLKPKARLWRLGVGAAVGGDQLPRPYAGPLSLGLRAGVSRDQDKRYRQRIDYIAGELAACQQAAGTGLVCAFPKGPALVAAHLRGEPITGVPWYTLHKVYAGLRDAVELAGSEAARPVLIRLADWGVVATKPLSDAQFETMLETEYGGMNEVYADLYFMTGNDDYRRLAERFSQRR